MKTLIASTFRYIVSSQNLKRLGSIEFACERWVRAAVGQSPAPAQE